MFGLLHALRTPRTTALCALLVTFLVSGWVAQEAAAQRPFRIYDPFYRDETARRTFFARYAFTAEVSYRPQGLLNNDADIDFFGQGARARTTDPLGVNLRVDYKLAPRFDLGLIIDAAGGPTGRNLSASWVTLKYYRADETTNYALRLAVDPASDGRSGFPQMDLAFLYRSVFTPHVTSDFALGVRRVRLGYTYRENEVLLPSPTDPAVLAPASASFRHARAVGLEIHAMMSYNIHFDPAGSKLFVTLLGQGGDYDLVDLGLIGGGTAENPAARQVAPYRGGVLWARSGLEIARPSYQLAPFLGIPLLQWANDAGADPDAGTWPRANMHIGLRLMLR